MKFISIPIVVLVFFLAGCSAMIPEYKRPDSPVPAVWPEGPAYKAYSSAKPEKPLAEIPWQEYYTDARLKKVMDLALENNRDLRIAALTIERARAQFQISRAELFPKVDAAANGNFVGVSKDLSRTGSHETVHEYTVSLGVSSYELDLFGRIRSLKEQALEQYLATEQAQRSVRISLVSQVATAWLTLTADRERLKLAQDTLASQEESYRLTKSRYDSGVSSALVLNQSRTSVDAARVDTARLTALVAQDENSLNLLVGSKVPAELLPQTLSESFASVADIPPGVPSGVLLMRPDIMQAERDLKGFNANIGAARAAFFPRITLNSSVGFASTELSGLFNNDTLIWTFVPRISLPIFNAGANEANLKVSETDRSIAVARYEKAIQTAFREVADALAQRGTIDSQLSAQQSLTDASAESHKLSRVRYDNGVDSYLQVLDAQRSLYSAEQNLISVRLTRLASQVTMYKVLGGGGGSASGTP